MEQKEVQITEENNRDYFRAQAENLNVCYSFIKYKVKLQE